MNPGLIISFLLLFVFILLGITLSILTTVVFSPVVHTPKEVLGEIIKIINPKDKEIIYDLGSGDGRVLVACRKMAKIKGIGFDISPMIVFFSKFVRFLNLGFTTDLVLDVANIFDTNLDDADKIYIYQRDKILKVLEKKFEKELEGVKVYAYKYPLEKKKASKKHKLSNGEYLFEYKY